MSGCCHGDMFLSNRVRTTRMVPMSLPVLRRSWLRSPWKQTGGKVSQLVPGGVTERTTRITVVMTCGPQMPPPRRRKQEVEPSFKSTT